MNNIPTNVIILGVTGDLTAKKILPALFNLWKKQVLPTDCNIIGFGRREMDNQNFLIYCKGLLEKKLQVSDADFAEFSKKLSYVQGLFEAPESYAKLGEYLDKKESGWVNGQRLFYLAVPPEIYGTIFGHLNGSGLGQGGPKKTNTKILVEKPFGKNQKTAEDLDSMLGELFQEHQIYRIDHYLAKEMIQNILTFRFSNDLFEKVWSNQFIEKIEIRTWETLGVEQRGTFYDSVGTLRDIGQNHLLQMLALMTMDAPLDYSSQAIQLKRAQIMQTLKPMTAADIEENSYRAQYDGFTDIGGVKQDSQTETFFKLKAELAHPRWTGVPIYLEGGKRIKEQIKDIVVTFKHENTCICPPGIHYTNRIIISLEPRESIQVEFWSKKPGLENDHEKRTLDFMLRQDSERAQYVEEYEKLLADALRGDQTLFVSTSEVGSMWRFIDPIVESWQRGSVPLNTYPPDSIPKIPYF